VGALAEIFQKIRGAVVGAENDWYKKVTETFAEHIFVDAFDLI